MYWAQDVGDGVYMRRSQSGYSLFELIILIVVLAIVCYFIFLHRPGFYEERPEEIELVAAEHVRIGIHNYAIRSKQLERRPVYPLTLDDAEKDTEASESNPLFTALYPNGIRSGWKKLGPNQYIFLPSTTGPVTPDVIYYYDAMRGTFEKGKPGIDSRVA